MLTETTTKSIVENRDCMAAMVEFPDKFFDLGWLTRLTV